MKNCNPMRSIYRYLTLPQYKIKGIMKIVVLTLLELCFGIHLQAQNALRDIPSPDPQIQKDMFHVADGFEVNLFASDPDVVKPIQMNWDAEGRLWVVSSTAYPHLRPGESANDKIIVLEDTNGDGKSDKSTVFAEGLITPTGILPGDGGVYVANSTEILHLKDTNGDGKADVKEKILTGFGTGDTHHLIHTFRWGPDGLMYFNQSIYIYSHVETPWGIRRLEGGGVWQYNPQTKKLEVFAKGLINPWGLQFDKWGKAFLTDGAGTEGINYAFPGATFVTAPGAERVLKGLNPGQPKHSGLDIVSGGHLPDSWHGSLITNDFRANRVNRFVLEETPNGMISRQAEDLLWTDHIGFRPVDILVGPDGAIYIADWYNPIIQHGEVDFHDPRRDQEHGRIWRLTRKGSPLVKSPNLNNMDVTQLVAELKAAENNTRLQAKLLLKSKDKEKVVSTLNAFTRGLDSNGANKEHHLLEALWTFQAIGEVNEQLLKDLLNAKQAGARAAAVRVLSHWMEHIPGSLAFLEKAVADNDPNVRLEALIALGKINSPEAAKMALNVLDQPMNEFLDFALWQSVRELKDFWMPRLLSEKSYFESPEKTVFALSALNDAESAEMLAPIFLANEVPEAHIPRVIQVLARNGDKATAGQLFQQSLSASNSQILLLDALIQMKKQRGIQPDSRLDLISQLYSSSEEEVLEKALVLSGLWNLEGQLNQMLDFSLLGSRRIKTAAMEALATMESEKGNLILQDLASNAKNKESQVLALSQLARSNPEKAIAGSLSLWRDGLSETEVLTMFAAFLSSEKGTAVLFQNLGEGSIPEAVAKTGRKAMQQYLPWHRRNSTMAQNLRNALEASGGILPPERMPQDLTEQQVYALAQEVKTKADPIVGESIYRRKTLMCQSCHALGGAGGKLGPDLSSLGSSLPIDNIIASLLDPAASVKEGYELQEVNKTDGSLMMGYLVSDGASELIMRDMAGNEITIPKSQVAGRENVSGSLMPPGLTASLERQEFIDLVGYLSKLGTSGDFRVPTANYVRRWKAFSVLDVAISGKLAEGKSIPLYSTVSGSLPVTELPVLKSESGKEMAVLQFELELLSEGKVALEFNETKGLSVWAADQMASIQANTALLKLPKGKHLIQVSIDLGAFNPSALRLKVTDQGSAQSRF
ncbi:dehydrogenase [Cyclobacterium sp. GBPx2]|uniref:Dehydrogenase n=2 Tax=Cyclobacterium plantarum TaxID=2716263 RepID=A0ABX0HET2_9BACT|nr:dehydrogenase [Cyclobacterium plantarum]